MDPTTSKGIIDSLLSLGLPGVIIICMGVVIIKLYNKADALQEKRIEESREIITTTNDMTKALGSLADLIKGMGAK